MSLYSTACIRGHAISPDDNIWPEFVDGKGKRITTQISRPRAKGKQAHYDARDAAKANWWAKLKQYVGHVLSFKSGARYRVHPDGSFRRVSPTRQTSD